MNWARGFVRAWLALSVVYVALSVWVNEPKTFRPLWKPSPIFEIAFEDGATVSFDTSKPLSLLRTEVSAAWLSHADNLISKEKRSGAEDEALLATVVPPLGLLCLGLIIAWVLSGFRHSRK